MMLSTPTYNTLPSRVVYFDKASTYHIEWLSIDRVNEAQSVNIEEVVVFARVAGILGLFEANHQVGYFYLSLLTIFVPK